MIKQCGPKVGGDGNHTELQLNIKLKLIQGFKVTV